MAEPTEEEIAEEEEKQIRLDTEAEIFDGKAPVIEEEPAAELDDIKKEDPLAGLDPALLETLSGINSRLSILDGIESRLKQTENRIGSIQNKAHDAQKAAELADKNKPTEEEVAAALETTEAWEKFEKEFPDMAKAVDGKVKSGMKDSVTVDDLREEIKTLKSKETPENLEVRLVGLVHPGWEKTVATKEYKDWLSSQPDYVKRRASHGEKADDAVSVLNAFKDSVSVQVTAEEIAAAKKKRLESSEVKKTNHKSIKQKSTADMNEAETRRDVEAEVFGK